MTSELRQAIEAVWRQAARFEHPMLGVQFGEDAEPAEPGMAFIVDEVDAEGRPAHLIRCRFELDGDGKLLGFREP